jgi:hypothetical protein
MEPNQFEEKVHELEETMTERSGEIARTRYRLSCRIS